MTDLIVHFGFLEGQAIVEAMRKLSTTQKRQIAGIAAKKAADIDLREMPEVVDWSGAEMGKFYRKPVFAIGKKARRVSKGRA